MRPTSHSFSQNPKRPNHSHPQPPHPTPHAATNLAAQTPLAARGDFHGHRPRRRARRPRLLTSICRLAVRPSAVLAVRPSAVLAVRPSAVLAVVPTSAVVFPTSGVAATVPVPVVHELELEHPQSRYWFSSLASSSADLVPVIQQGERRALDLHQGERKAKNSG